jgi:16S rRNA (adenine1518-N6/adenine1519-N6)-dimethyltransferase
MRSPRKILAERGLAARKEMGQHFLLDPNIVEKILDKADLDENTLILEIGPGLGALTESLLDRGLSVTAVELDSGLARYLEETLQPRAPGRFQIIKGDILGVDLEEMAASSGKPLTLIGNLPYQISSPLLFKILEVRIRIAQAVFMFQRELADRLVSGPGSKEYGRLSVPFAYYAHVVRLLDVGPAVFYPRPKIGSTVLRIRFKDAPEPLLTSEPLFHQVVRAGFSQRRKIIRNALLSEYPAEKVDAALASAKIEPGRRAETLKPAEFVNLANALHSA